MSHLFEQNVLDFIETERLFKGKRILLAVSGGADSIALLLVLHKLCKQSKLPQQLVAVHINHNLRGEMADRDQAFVCKTARELGIDVIVRSVDVAGHARETGVSIETAGRQLRRKLLVEIARETGCESIATGHHKDDLAETVIHRLQRGCGFLGLCGIWPKKQFEEIFFVRPLLCVSRKEIEQYCTEQGIRWCDDHTNQDTTFTRNQIRHCLLPGLQEHSTTDLVGQLEMLSKKALLLHQRIESEIDRVWSEVVVAQDSIEVKFSCPHFDSQPLILKPELLRRALVSIGCGQRHLTELHYKKMIEMTSAQAGKKLELPGNYEVINDRERLIFKRVDVKQNPPLTEMQVAVPGRTLFNGWVIETQLRDFSQHTTLKKKNSFDSQQEVLDYERIELPLTVRVRLDGDVFVPLGMKKAKKVGKFITDMKISADLCKKVFIVQDRKKIIWLAPLRLCEEVKITENTQKILEISIKRL